MVGQADLEAYFELALLAGASSFCPAEGALFRSSAFELDALRLDDTGIASKSSRLPEATVVPEASVVAERGTTRAAHDSSVGKSVSRKSSKCVWSCAACWSKRDEFWLAWSSTLENGAWAAHPAPELNAKSMGEQHVQKRHIAVPGLHPSLLAL